MRVGIIGGGAAGLFSAIHLKLMNPNFEVTILERDSRVGKKILATGNGKCNITNLKASEKDYNDSKVLYALNNFSVFDTINYFKKLGLMIKFDSEGRCYPYSEKATTVLDVFMNMINRLKINICTNYEVVHVKAYDDFMVYSRDYGLKHFDYLIVSTGGKSGINFNNESYNFLEYLGHTVTNLYPGLVPLKTKEKLKNLSGIRSKAKVKLLREQKLIFNTTGEVLYKEEGLSGISIMEVSRHALPGDVISLDLVYDLSDIIVTAAAVPANVLSVFRLVLFSAHFMGDKKIQPPKKVKINGFFKKSDRQKRIRTDSLQTNDPSQIYIRGADFSRIPI